MTEIVCPRCGARDSFMKGYLPDTCLCRVCQSQLDWREIPGCGPDCKPVVPEPPPPTAPNYVTATAAPAKSSEAGEPAEPPASGETAGVTESREGAGAEPPEKEKTNPAAKDPASQERGAEER